MQAIAATPGLPMSTVTTKPLWAAVGVLGVAVLAMGASLVHIQTRPVDGQIALAAAPATIVSPAADASKVSAADSLRPQEALVAAPAARLPAPIPPAGRPAPRVATNPAPDTVAATPQARSAIAAIPVQPGAQPSAPAVPSATLPDVPAVPSVTAAPSPMVTNAPPSSPVVSDAATANPMPVILPARPVCASCGTIESVTAFERKASPNGIGVVAGGVLGAVVGNQFGKGSGRTATTILGAIGGGVAGNMIEKNIRRETAYQVRVRMDDGSVRTLEQAKAPAVGSKVTVDGSVLRSADGAWSSVPPAASTPAPAMTPRPQPDHRA